MFKFNKLSILIIICVSLFCCAAQYLESNGVDDDDNANSIPIGLISDQYEVEMQIVFEHAIDMANYELNERNDESSSQLTPVIENIYYGDSFDGYNKLCNIMQRGVGAVFGPSSKNTANHLSNVCDAKDVPYINCKLNENSEGFNLYPDLNDVASAIHSLITAADWSQFIYLYESAEHLNILNMLLALYQNDEMPKISVLRYDLQMDGNYKPVLSRVRKSEDNCIVVVGSTDSMPQFLKQAQQVGIISEDYKYIFSNLDFHAFDLEEYKYSEANITAFRLFSPQQEEVRLLLDKLYNTDEDQEAYMNGSCPITLEMALMYDAIQLFAETTEVLPFEPKPLNCSDSESVREDGTTFKNYMRSMRLTRNTLTGNINFEGNTRKGYKFDVIELQPSGLLKVGSWDDVKGLTLQRMPETTVVYDNLENSLANQTFIILISAPNKPYASLKESTKQLTGNDQYEGYGVDLVNELASKLGFKYEFKNFGKNYGSYNKTTKIATGMLKEIMEGRAHLAVTDLTMTSEREEAVDFSIPFMNLGISILYLRPKKAPPELFTFMDPFSMDVWWYLGLSFIGVSLSFFILGRLSPHEWDNPYPCLENPTELENQFTIGNSLWFTTGALLQQGSEIGPKALSTRTIGSIWWFFVLLIVSSYTANLAAFLTIEKPTSPIENVDDLAENKGGVQYGANRNGATRKFFLTSKDERFQKMNLFMEEHPDLLTASNEEGVAKVKSSSHYAFLMESTTIEYNTMRECDLKKIGDPLDEKGYGIAMPKGWPFREKFNRALLEMQEQNVLAKMKTKWWNEVGSGICTTKPKESDVSSLDMKNLGGVYCVLIVGSLLAMLYGVITWIFFVKRKAKHYKVPLKDAFWEELKFVMDFNAYTRVLKSSASVYSRSRSSVSIDSIEPDANTAEC